MLQTIVLLCFNSYWIATLGIAKLKHLNSLKDFIYVVILYSTKSPKSPSDHVKESVYLKSRIFCYNSESGIVAT